MKMYRKVFSLLVFVGCLNLSLLTLAEAKKSKASQTKTVALKLSGLTCGGCVRNVTKKLKSIQGVLAAKVTLKPMRAVVSYNAKKCNPKQMIQAIKKSGYGAKVAEPKAVPGKKKKSKK